MPSVRINIDTRLFSARLNEMLRSIGSMEEVWQDAAQYMVNSTRNRILRQKVSPSGEAWAPLSEVTIELKGHDRALFHTGELARSIEVTSSGPDGFTVAAQAEHASYMQNGVKRTGGFIPNKRVPARPFMGFSEANKRRISRMLRDHIDGRNGMSGGDE